MTTSARDPPPADVTTAVCAREYGVPYLTMKPPERAVRGQREDEASERGGAPGEHPPERGGCAVVAGQEKKGEVHELCQEGRSEHDEGDDADAPPANVQEYAGEGDEEKTLEHADERARGEDAQAWTPGVQGAAWMRHFLSDRSESLVASMQVRPLKSWNMTIMPVATNVIMFGAPFRYAVSAGMFEKIAPSIGMMGSGMPSRMIMPTGSRSMRRTENRMTSRNFRAPFMPRLRHAAAFP